MTGLLLPPTSRPEMEEGRTRTCEVYFWRLVLLVWLLIGWRQQGREKVSGEMMRALLGKVVSSFVQRRMREKKKGDVDIHSPVCAPWEAFRCSSVCPFLYFILFPSQMDKIDCEESCFRK